MRIICASIHYISMLLKKIISVHDPSLLFFSNPNKKKRERKREVMDNTSHFEIAIDVKTIKIHSNKLTFGSQSIFFVMRGCVIFFYFLDFLVSVYIKLLRRTHNNNYNQD